MISLTPKIETFIDNKDELDIPNLSNKIPYDETINTIVDKVIVDSTTKKILPSHNLIILSSIMENPTHRISEDENNAIVKSNIEDLSRTTIISPNITINETNMDNKYTVDQFDSESITLKIHEQKIYYEESIARKNATKLIRYSIKENK